MTCPTIKNVQEKKLFVDDSVASYHDWALLYPTCYMGTLDDELLMNA